MKQIKSSMNPDKMNPEEELRFLSRIQAYAEEVTNSLNEKIDALNELLDEATTEICDNRSVIDKLMNAITELQVENSILRDINNELMGKVFHLDGVEYLGKIRQN